MATMTERRRGERRKESRPVAQERRAGDRRLLLALAIKAWRLGYRPYDPVIVEDGRVLEAIGYPFPDGMGIAIMARKWGDPTTVAKYRLPDKLPDVLITGEEANKEIARRLADAHAAEGTERP